MKLHSDTREVLKSGVGEETQFKIKATGKAFQILSSGLYSNKILAIIRELSCNAYDAHVAAGKSDVPIEITLPTSLKPTFSVKDFGVGLDDDNVKNLYTTYFESTKQDSNDYIGALGLGSKSPFSYVSSFTVESRFNKTKRLYTAFINEQGLPSITLMDEQPTDEPNGLTISMAVKQSDLSRFHEEARKALMYFNPKPIVKGAHNFEPLSLSHTVKGSNWKVRQAAYGAQMEGPYVVQGFVAYPVDSEQLRQHRLSEAASAILGVNIDLTVSMGEVEVAASREALSYDERTVKNLIKSIEVAAKEMRTTMQAEIDKCTTLWEATCKYNQFADTGDYDFRNLFNSMHRTNPFMWKGTKLDNNITFSYDNIKKTTFIRGTVYTVGRRAGKVQTDGKMAPLNQAGRECFVNPNMLTKVYVDDQFKSGNAMIAQHHVNKQIESGSKIVILRPTSKSDYSKKEIETILKHMGNPEITYISTLDKVVANGTKYVKRDSDTRLKWTGFPKNGGYHRNELRRVFSRLCWATDTIDLKAGGFYVPIERFTVMDNDKEVTSFDDIIFKAQMLDILDAKVSIYGFNEKEVLVVKHKKNWINLFDHLRAELESLNPKNCLLEHIGVVQAIGSLGHSVNNFFIRDWKNLSKKIEQCSFKTFFETIVEMQNAVTKKYSHEAADILIRLLGFDKDSVTEKVKTKIDHDWQSMLKEYEMLQLVTWNYLTKPNVEMIINYINVVAKTKP